MRRKSEEKQNFGTASEQPRVSFCQNIHNSLNHMIVLLFILVIAYKSPVYDT